MADMDVSLRLRLLNQLSAPAKDAKKDIEALTAAAKKAGGKGGADLAAAFDKTARAAGKAQRDVRSMAGALKMSWAPAIAGARSYSVALDKVRYNVDKVVKASERSRRRAPLPLTPPPRAPQPSRTPIPIPAPSRHETPPPSGRAKAAASGALAAHASSVGEGALYGLAGTAAAAMGVAATTQKSLALEKVMYDVQKATDASAEGLKRYETFLNDTARASGKSAEELGQMLAAAGYAGRPVKELTRFVQYAAKATNAWGLSAEQTGQSMAEIGNIYQADQKRIEEIGDAINTAADMSAARESDLLDFIRRVGGAAKAQGIGAEQTLAFGAALKEIGVSTEVAATGMNAFINMMTQGEEADDKVQEGLKKIGLDATKMAKAFSRKPVETMTDLLQRIDAVKDGVKRNQILLALFGKEYGDDIGRMVGAVPRLNELLATMADKRKYLGSVAKSAELMSEKDYNRLERAQAAIDQMSRTIGGPLKVAAGEVATEFNRVAERIATGAGLLDRLRAERDAFDDAAGKKLGAQEARPQGKTASDKLDDYFFGEEGKRDAQLQQARRAGWRKAGEARRTSEDAALRQRADVQRRYDVRRSRGYYQGKSGGEPDALQRELEHLDEVARRIHQSRAAAEKKLSEITASLGDAQARKSQIGRWGADPTAKPWAQTPDKAPELGSVSPGLSMMPAAKALTGPKSAGWMKAAAGEATKLSIAVQDAADKASTLSTTLGSDLSGPANSAMASYNAALQAGVDRALKIAKDGAAALSSALSFSASPSISPRLAPSSATSSPGVKAGGKSARASGGNVSIAQAHFHGVKDMAGVHRQALAHVDRSARGARAGALHDVETG